MHRAISPASPPSSASRDSAAPAVSITVTSGRSRSAASRMPRRACRSAARAERAPGGLAVPVLSEQHAGHVTEPDERQEQSGVVLALAGSVERQHVGGGVEEQLANPGPVRAARGGHRLPRRDLGWCGVPACGRLVVCGER